MGFLSKAIQYVVLSHDDVGFLSKAIQYVVLSDDDVGFLSKAIQYVVLSDGCGFLVKGHSVCSVIR